MHRLRGRINFLIYIVSRNCNDRNRETCTPHSISAHSDNAVCNQLVKEALGSIGRSVSQSVNPSVGPDLQLVGWSKPTD